MLSFNLLFENARAARKTTQAMLEHFTNRTNYHIKLVQDYIQKIINLNDPRIDNKILEKEKLEHDQSKFEDPEFEPYLHINWHYYLKDLGRKYNPPENIKNQMDIATFHHITTNQHHPDYWDKNITLDSLNNKDRDKPPKKIVDATKMPLTYIASMVADHLAMSEEKKTDPYVWEKQNIGIRWEFNKEQIKLIYDLLDKIWTKKK